MNELMASQIIILVAATISAIGGLSIVILQKKGIMKAVLAPTLKGFDFKSGGSITFFSTIIGTYILFGYSKLWAVLYGVMFIGCYILIQILMRNKK